MSTSVAPTEPPAPSAPAAHPSAVRPARDRPSLARRLLRGDALWWPTLLVAGFACFVTFVPKGGLNLESMTTTEIVITLVGGLGAALAVLFTPIPRSLVEGRKYGLWPLGLVVAFAALSALSVVWSVQPDASFRDAGRMFAYCAVFGAAIALVRLAPSRWPAILGGLTLGAAIVCGYALATKVFPGRLAPLVSFARLEEPYGYWNAIGLTAAMGAIGCMWLGARRAGHALLNALAYPAMGLMLVTIMLAYSRGALVALAIGLVLWFCMVPLRLRGAAVLIVGALGAGAVVAWDFSRHALTTDSIPLMQRALAGHQLGALLVVMVVLLTFVSIAIGFFTDRRAPTLISRRRAGALLLGLIVVGVIACGVGLAESHRGFTGSISHAVDSVTNPNAKPPPNTPGRLTAVASVRARYWKEALQIFEAHPALGAGASGYETARQRYRKATLEVKHAHGFVVQTLADLGIVGLLLSLALLLTWMDAAGRATHPFNRRWTSWRAWLQISKGGRPGWRSSPEPYTPERIATLCMLCLVVVFGVHSLVDWTWYVPGNACVALLCAGWLAGRGPLRAVAGDSSVTREWIAKPEGPLGRELHASRSRAGGWVNRFGPMRIGIAVAVVIAALLAAWSQWQPQRSVEASQEALALLARDPRAALAEAQTAVARDPLSAQALFTLAAVQQANGQSRQAKATLQRAVKKQPSNPQTWLALGRFDLTREPAAALNELRATIYLNPEAVAPEAIASGNQEAVEIQNDYIQALRAANTTTAAAGGAAAKRAALGGALVGGAAARHHAAASHRAAARRRAAARPGTVAGRSAISRRAALSRLLHLPAGAHRPRK